MSAVRLTDIVWLVGSSDHQSPAFTDEHDCSQYLIWQDGLGFLIDAGTGLGAQTWLANVAEVAALDSLHGVLVTHYHADHGGGSAFAERVGLRIFASETTAKALTTADDQITQLARARAAGIYPPDYHLKEVSEVSFLGDFDELPLPFARLTAIEAPGHCDGHLTFLLDTEDSRALFSGDVIFANGRVSIQAIPDCRLDEYAETVIGLDEMDLDQLFPGHGEVVLSDASAHIAPAAAAFRSLIPPPNLLTPPGFEPTDNS